MANLHTVQEAVISNYFSGLLDDEEFILLYDANQPSNPDFQFRNYAEFNLDSFNDDECNAYFRFKKEDILKLKRALRIPDNIRCRNGYLVGGVEGLCILLARFAFPCRYSDLIRVFARDVPQLCLITAHMIDHIITTSGHLLDSLDQPWLSSEMLSVYARAVHDKGAVLINCWGFVDGTVRPICRPKQHQGVMYNGHKRVHGLKYQSVTCANGLIAHLYGPIEGRRHDCYMLRESGLMQQLEQHSVDQDGSILCIYGDPAYPLRAHLQCPFKGNQLTEAQQEYNRSMSSVRVSVEWLFGDIINNFKSIDFKKNQKVGLSSCAKMYKVSALMTNAHVCLYGNSTSRFFGLVPPTLEEYFSV